MTAIAISDDPRSSLPIWAWLAWMEQVAYHFEVARLKVDYSIAEITQVSLSARTVNISYTVRWAEDWESNYSSLFYNVAEVSGGLLKYLPKQKES